MNSFQTKRLIIRVFKYDDHGEIYCILDVELEHRDSSGEVASIYQRKKWLDWTIKGYEQNKIPKNPPYSDNGVVFKENMQLIVSCGIVPVMAPNGSIPFYRYIANVDDKEMNYAEIGLSLAISPYYQCKGVAFEAADALIKFAFGRLKLSRIFAVTTPHNNSSIAV